MSHVDRFDVSSLVAPGAAAAVRESLSVLLTGSPVIIDAADAAAVAAPAAGSPGSVLREVAAPVLAVGDPFVAPPWLVDVADACVTTHPAPPSPWVSSDPSACADAVKAQPLAALALVRLLRATPALEVSVAIAAEAATYAALLGSAAFATWRAATDAEHHVADEPVLLSRSGDVLCVELNRPRVHNAVDTALRDALVEALGLAESDPALRVELSGRGASFCAGGDLSEFGQVGDPATSVAVRATRHPGASAHRIAPRLTVRIHGACIGAGIELAAFAGHVVADPGTTMRLPELSMGLVPGAGGTVSLPRRIGRHRTAWLALSGEPVDARTALHWGLVDALG